MRARTSTSLREHVYSTTLRERDYVRRFLPPPSSASNGPHAGLQKTPSVPQAAAMSDKGRSISPPARSPARSLLISSDASRVPASGSRDRRNAATALRSSANALSAGDRPAELTCAVTTCLSGLEFRQDVQEHARSTLRTENLHLEGTTRFGYCPGVDARRIRAFVQQNLGGFDVLDDVQRRVAVLVLAARVHGGIVQQHPQHVVVPVARRRVDAPAWRTIRLRGAAATRLDQDSRPVPTIRAAAAAPTLQTRRDPSPRTINVVAAAPPRPASIGLGFARVALLVGLVGAVLARLDKNLDAREVAVGRGGPDVDAAELWHGDVWVVERALRRVVRRAILRVARAVAEERHGSEGAAPRSWRAVWRRFGPLAVLFVAIRESTPWWEAVAHQAEPKTALRS